MKRSILFILIILFHHTLTAQYCIEKKVDKIFDTSFYGNYYIVIPVETLNYEKARLLITKEWFKKYVTILNHNYLNKDSIKLYLTNLLIGKQKMYFDEYIFGEYYDKPQYLIISDKNKNDISSKKKKLIFLKKYLIPYSPNTKFYNIIGSLPNPMRRFDFLVETLFKLNYLLAEGDQVIGVSKVDCEN